MPKEDDLMVRFASMINTLAKLAEEIDKGGTLIVRQPDGTEKEYHLAPLHKDKPMEEKP